jgi:protoporphyrinogen/coproporphyrinogen III oxidase
MKKLVVLGGGISGLSLLWNLKKRFGDQHSLILLEKSSRVGGWIRTKNQSGFVFESGPRSFQLQGNGKYTLQLIEELGLQDQVITAAKEAHHRYLYINKTLEQVPSSFFSFISSPLTRNLCWNLLKEWTVPAGVSEDESVHEFFSRRLGPKATNIFVDALVSGIYAGDMHHLSMKACFPRFFEWERQYGSLTKGALFGRKQNDLPQSEFIRRFEKHTIGSFNEGMETLPRALYEKLQSHIQLKQNVQKLSFQPNGIEIRMEDGSIQWADHLFSTVPSHVLSGIMPGILNEIPMASIAAVNLGYKASLLDKKGFGYLIPSVEKEDVLGMVWDSCVFPQQSLSADETRLTVMMGGTRMSGFSDCTESGFLASALEAVKNHLNIDVEPDQVNVSLAENAIPQYPIGHLKKLEKLQSISPHLTIVGSSFEGVAVNDCVAKAYKTCLNTIQDEY